MMECACDVCVCVEALVCWLLYAMNRKRKAERYAQALESHRCLLLHIGVTQWVQVGTLLV